MNANELADYFRSQVRDDVAPYLWSDDELFVYMNEAQKMFVRLTNGIYDVTSEACSVAVTAGEKYTTLHPTLLTIRKAYYVNPTTNERRELRVINLSDTNSLTTSDYGVFNNPSLGNTPGVVTHMVIGEERGKARWINIPVETTTVEMAIARLPLTSLSPSQTALEVPDEHHVSLIEWMKHLAYNKQDGDAYNPKTSAESEARFRAYCEFVWKEWERYRHKPRSVAYGGI